MAHGKAQHPNAALTPIARRKMVACVAEQGWPVAAVAERFQVDPKTVREWCGRLLAGGSGGLSGRFSRPRTSPGRTPAAKRAGVVELRRHRWGADRIARRVGLAAFAVQSILRSGGLGRLDRGDRAFRSLWCATFGIVLVSWSMSMRRRSPRSLQEAGTAAAATAARAPVAAKPAIGSFTPPLMTAPAWRAQKSSTTNKAPPPPGSGQSRSVVRPARHRLRTGPHRQRSPLPQHSLATSLREHTHQHQENPAAPPPNQRQAERFHRALLEERAYISPWEPEHQRHNAHNGLIHHCNHHRPHSALNPSTPAATLNRLPKDNLPADYN